jgi:hypothetical protein
MISLLLSLTAGAAPAEIGGYFRIMTRPDVQGGSGRLGFWNLYGRLLNEGPYATLDFRFRILERSTSLVPWTSLHARIEGGSIGNADPQNGNLSQLRLSQTYVLAGNVIIPDVVWQLGTLDTYFGDLGLYDMRPAQIFFETVGISARYQKPHYELLFGLGDSGYGLKGTKYNTIPTVGGTARIRPFNGLEIGAGGQFRWEQGIEGNQTAPYATPNITYEEYIRGEFTQNFLLENPVEAINFPNPKLRNAQSSTLIGYLGFGGFGPIIWNNFYTRYEQLHPLGPTTESFEGETYTIYTTDLTDERTVFTLGNELQLRIVPNRFDITWAALYSNSEDADNDILASDGDRTVISTVLRGQYYMTDHLHLLLEGSAAQEKSKNGNLFREHADSIFRNTEGISDTRGLEYGDRDVRYTFQGKGGLVINPMGKGIFNRPSLRILYGIQYSNQNNAFGNQFVETLDQYNDFGNVEQHIHQLIALETEAWF